MSDEDVSSHESTNTVEIRPGAVASRGGRVFPLPTSATQLTSGVLHDWQARNRERTIPHSIRELRLAGNIDNLLAAAEGSTAPYRGRYPFLDTDIYKTVEGLAYELTKIDADGETREFFEESVRAVEAAQAPDGYLNSYFQRSGSEKAPWSDLAWGHELYNLGHLIQAAVASSRQLGDDRLLAVATRFADLAVDRFGGQENEQVCGHPEVEMALVELFRTTGTRAYLDLAEAFINRRGRGSVVLSVFPAEYFQDNLPLRELPSVTGHAVRMVYLAAGAVDVYLETGDPSLLDATARLWADMVSTKLYITGGLGSRHSDEAIGDRFELPSERSYSETCAAIGTMQWAWRMFLATGKSSYLDSFETVLYNGYAGGLSADGRAFFYDNALQRRPDHTQRSGAEPDGELLRRSWFGCPCCPPNIVRWNSQLQDYLAATDASTLYIAQYSGATIQSNVIGLSMTTTYPWDGTVTFTVERAEPGRSTLALRIPGWCHEASVTVNGDLLPVEDTDGWARIERAFSGGDEIVLHLPMPVRAHGSHPSVDATRGAVALARGPLVYAAEQQDNDENLDDLVLAPSAVATATTWAHQLTPDTPEDTVLITMPALSAPSSSDELYPELGRSQPLGTTETATVTLVPYYQWGNRAVGGMRVWLRST